jgi:hypothetical protein
MNSITYIFSEPEKNPRKPDINPRKPEKSREIPGNPSRLFPPARLRLRRLASWNTRRTCLSRKSAALPVPRRSRRPPSPGLLQRLRPVPSGNCEAAANPRTRCTAPDCAISPSVPARYPTELSLFSITWQVADRLLRPREQSRAQW